MTREEIMKAQEYLRQIEWDLLSCGRSYEQAAEELASWREALLPRDQITHKGREEAK